MNFTLDLQHIGTVTLVAAFVLWRIYRRVQRLTTRQPLRPIRAWFSVMFFPLLILGLLFGIASTPLQSISKLVGVLIGVVVAVYALRHTQFEIASDGVYYTPNRYIGGGLALLLVARIAWRFFELYQASAALTGFTSGLLKSPLTLFVIGILAGYYAWYAFGLLRWRSAMIAEQSRIGSA